MQRVFRSRIFILVMIVVALVAGLTAYSSTAQGRASFLPDLAGIIITPIQKACTQVSGTVGHFFSYFTEQDAIRKENTELKTQILDLQSQLRDYDQYKYENDQLKNYLGIKDSRPDFDFEIAEVIARDPGNWYEIFTIDKGSLNGIAPKNTVITADGLVGYVMEVGTTWAKVVTILDPVSSYGAIISRTRDVGIVEGDTDLKEQGLCKLTDLSTENTAVKGDTVETSGLGTLFPRGIVIGKIQEVSPEPHGISSYAVIEPAVDFKNIREVMVIKNFNQDGGDTNAH